MYIFYINDDYNLFQYMNNIPNLKLIQEKYEYHM